MMWMPYKCRWVFQNYLPCRRETILEFMQLPIKDKWLEQCIEDAIRLPNELRAVLEWEEVYRCRLAAWTGWALAKGSPPDDVFASYDAALSTKKYRKIAAEKRRWMTRRYRADIVRIENDQVDLETLTAMILFMTGTALRKQYGLPHIIRKWPVLEMLAQKFGMEAECMEQIEVPSLMECITESVYNDRMYIWDYIYRYSKEYKVLYSSLKIAADVLPSNFMLGSYADPAGLGHYLEPYLFHLGFQLATNPTDGVTTYISQHVEVIKATGKYQQLYQEYLDGLYAGRKRAKSLRTDIEDGILCYQEIALVGLKWHMIFGYYCGVSFAKTYFGQKEDKKYTKAFMQAIDDYWNGDFYELCKPVC